jgi:hypothetical protein
MLRRTSKSKHRKAKYKVQGSNPSQSRPEWLRSTRTTTMANKCDCTSFLPSQLFASPQQTQFIRWWRQKSKISIFDFCQKWGSCMSCTRWVECVNVMYMVWLCVGRAFSCCVARSIWLRIEEIISVWTFGSLPPCFLWLTQFHLHFTVQTAVETSSLLIFQSSLVFSNEEASS